MKEQRWIEAQQASFEAKYPREFARDRSAAGVFVLSFPKSGRTWHRVMLGVYLAKLLGRPVETAFSLEKLCREAEIDPIVYSHNGANFMDWLAPDHELVANSSVWRGKPVILLVREPKDILVSAYYHARFRGDLFDGSISDFVRDPRTGIEKILNAYARWNRDQGLAKSFHVTSYEAMHAQPEEAIRACLITAGARSIDDKLLSETVSFCRFENMRRYEEEGFFKSGRLNRTSDDPRASKVRSGRVGAYHQDLSAEDIAYIDAAIAGRGNPFESAYRLPLLAEGIEATKARR